MKKFIFLFFNFLTTFSFSQNLVSNPSFEDTVYCPVYPYPIMDACQGWWNAANPANSTPDYFNGCAIGPGMAPPNATWGYQVPHSGVAYPFVATYITTISNRREYIQTQLIQNIVIGQKYFVSFYINLPGGAGISFATNKMGAFFTTYQFGTNNPAFARGFAHVYTDSIISNTQSWYHFKSSFIADSNYQYITKGNFFYDSQTDTIRVSPNAYASGYYIDDVCVSTDSLLCYTYTNIINNDVITKSNFYPSPADECFTIVPYTKITAIKIYTISGILIAEHEVKNNQPIKINTKNWKGGIYMVKINDSYYKQLIIH